MYVPQKLQEYFVQQKETFGSNIIVRGQLSCCGSYCFSVSYFGQMETGKRKNEMKKYIPLGKEFTQKSGFTQDNKLYEAIYTIFPLPILV